MCKHSRVRCVVCSGFRHVEVEEKVYHSTEAQNPRLAVWHADDAEKLTGHEKGALFGTTTWSDKGGARIERSCEKVALEWHRNMLCTSFNDHLSSCLA